jgi:hypothetical protein
MLGKLGKVSGDDLKHGDTLLDQFAVKGENVFSGRAERGAGAQFDNVGLHVGEETKGSAAGSKEKSKLI